MPEFLTLAITETVMNSGKFNVIAMEMQSHQIVPLGLQKEDIISSGGEVFWDIGFTTVTQDMPKRKYTSYNISSENSPFMITGAVTLQRNRVADLKSILEAKAINPRAFFENQKHQFAIVKVEKIEELRISEDKNKDEVKHYMTARIVGLPAHQNPLALRNKDFRWISFWNWVHRMQLNSEKKNKYMSLLNRQEKDLYLILYRHNFTSGPQHWIVGMHWL